MQVIRPESKKVTVSGKNQAEIWKIPCVMNSQGEVLLLEDEF